METSNAKPPKKQGRIRKLDHDLISKRAYQIYLYRVQKGLPGNEAEDWLKAEKELREDK